jgi:hypothetical protein
MTTPDDVTVTDPALKAQRVTEQATPPTPQVPAHQYPDPRAHDAPGSVRKGDLARHVETGHLATIVRVWDYGDDKGVTVQYPGRPHWDNGGAITRWQRCSLVGSPTPWLDEIRRAVAEGAGPGAATEFERTAENAYHDYAGAWGEAWGQHAVRQAAKIILARTATATDPEVEAARAAGQETTDATATACTRHADEVRQAWSDRDAAFVTEHRGELQAAWPEGFAAAAASLGDGSGQSVAFADFPLIWNATAGFLGALRRPVEHAIAAERVTARQAAVSLADGPAVEPARAMQVARPGHPAHRRSSSARTRQHRTQRQVRGR